MLYMPYWTWKLDTSARIKGLTINSKFGKINLVCFVIWLFINGSSSNCVTLFENEPHCLKCLEIMAMIYPKLSKLSLSFRNHIFLIIIKLFDNVCGYIIVPKFVNQLIASSIQIIQIDSRHLLSYYMPISLVY